MQDSYLSHTEMDYASVDRASKACGPLYQWAASQIKYAVILKKIKPLRDEVQALVDQVKVENCSASPVYYVILRRVMMSSDCTT